MKIEVFPAGFFLLFNYDGVLLVSCAHRQTWVVTGQGRDMASHPVLVILALFLLLSSGTSNAAERYS